MNKSVTLQMFKRLAKVSPSKNTQTPKHTQTHKKNTDNNNDSYKTQKKSGRRIFTLP